MNQVAKKQEQALAVINDMFEADRSSGMENMSQEDLALPFLKVLSQLSPEIESVEGAKAGMIINTVTSKLYDGTKGVLVLPSYYERKYIEWAPRGTGSGAPLGVHPATSDILSKTFKKPNDSKDYLENGNYVETTAQHYVIVLDEAGSHPAMISMKSTQLKKSRKWNSMMMTVKKIGKDGKPYNPASFSNIYRLFTSKEVNDKGTWYGWEIERVSEVGEDRVNEYMEARTFAEAIKAGSVQVKHTEDDAAPRVTDTDAF
jgi:hypothetical protein